ncbi:MAG TPA: hypothetical protein VLI46_08255 [Ramlibacter sp.]|nr:hypothetical protein [Ramlibacter sp.]
MRPPSLAAKKEREQYLLRSFLDSAGLAAEVVDPDREAPDFVLQFEGRLVGLEVTEIFIANDGGPIEPRARESIGERIAKLARRRYEQLGGKPVHVTIGLTLGGELRDLNRSETAEKLARFLLTIDPKPNQYVAWEPSYDRDPLPPEVHYLHILGVPTWEMAHWYVPQSGWVAPLEEELLQAAIDEKSSKLRDYRLAAPECWLLLASEGWSASQLFDGLPELRPEAIRSPFDRTYFFSAFEKFVLQLTSRPT